MGIWWMILAGSLAWLEPGPFVATEAATQAAPAGALQHDEHDEHDETEDPLGNLGF